MFLVPSSNFIRKVLKVDGPSSLYDVVLKSAPPTPIHVAQARSFLIDGLIISLSKFQPSSGVEGTTAMPASHATVEPMPWRY
ncbi:hypothetical protein H5410_030877, partial [Solanum commersonii]